MSKQNKVNPGTYTQAGRLSPDDAARERMKQADTASTRHLEGRPPTQLKATPSGKSEADATDDDAAGDDTPDDSSDEEQPDETEQ